MEIVAKKIHFDGVLQSYDVYILKEEKLNDLLKSIYPLAISIVYYVPKVAVCLNKEGDICFLTSETGI